MHTTHGLRCLTAVLFTVASVRADAAVVVLDPAPVADLTVAGFPRAATALADGSVVVAGDITQFGALSRPGLGRLRADGSGDPAFTPSCIVTFDAIRSPCAVRSLLALQDGRVIVAGWLSEVDGQPRRGIARLLADGRVDPGWRPSLANPGHVAVLARQGDWLLVTDGSQRLHRIALQGPGDVDPAFAPDPAVFKAVVDRRGTVFVGANLQQQVARLDGVDGSVDERWFVGGAKPLSLHLAYDAVVDRLFAVTAVPEGPARYRIRRLDPIQSPALEVEWTPQVSGVGGPQPVHFAWIHSLLAGSGRLVVSGNEPGRQASVIWTFDADTGKLIARTPSQGPDGFQALSIDDQGRVLAAVETADRSDTLSPGGSSLVRLDATLRIDTAFAARTRSAGNVVMAAARADGSFAIAGQFTRVGDTPRDGLARFDASMRLMPDWRAPPAIAGEEGFLRDGGMFVSGLAFDAAGRLLVATIAGFGYEQLDYSLYRLDADTGRAGQAWAGFRSAYDGQFVLEPTPDGQGVFVGGAGLRRLCGSAADSIVRLRTDGACIPDPTFGISADGWIDSLRLSADGMLYVGGQFSRFGGNDLPRLARASALDGRVDGTWRPAPETTPPLEPFALAVGGGSVYIGGRLAAVAGQPVRGLARIGLGVAAADPFWRPLDMDADLPALAVGNSGTVLAAWTSSAAGTAGARQLAALPGEPPAGVGALLQPDVVLGYFERLLPLGDGRTLWTGGFRSIDGEERTGIALVREGQAAATFGDGFEPRPDR